MPQQPAPQAINSRSKAESNSSSYNLLFINPASLTPLGRAIRTARLELGWTQAVLAKQSSVTERELDRLEWGEDASLDLIDKVLATLRQSNPTFQEDPGFVLSTCPTPTDQDSFIALMKELARHRAGCLPQISKGQKSAIKYHLTVARIFTCLMWPSLSRERIEHSIQNGKKRIDIVYNNTGDSGFFGWLARHYASQQIPVECKNYSGEPTNEALDQIAGRFSPNRGQVGFLIFRETKSMAAVIRACQATARDGRGFIIPLSDEDLLELSVKECKNPGEFSLLQERFDSVIG